MVKMNAVYTGQKHCELTHESSGSNIETDAPKDNQGLGARFSPTDLVGAALISCMLTTMAIHGEKEGISVVGAKGSVEKGMANDPRRIQSLVVHLTLPANWTLEQRKKMEHFAEHCPVHRSLNPEVKIPIHFTYA